VNDEISSIIIPTLLREEHPHTYWVKLHNDVLDNPIHLCETSHTKETQKVWSEDAFF